MASDRLHLFAQNEIGMGFRRILGVDHMALMVIAIEP
jgi:hypothetical protein